MVERIESGIPRLDEHIEGGIPKGSLTLVSGGPGSGKTTFSIQFADKGIENGENCLYITTGQKSEEIKGDAAEYGIDLDKENFTITEVSPSNDVSENIREKIASKNFDRVVLDSISIFEMHWGEKDHLRKYINKLMNHFKDIDATVVITSERSENSSGILSRFGIAEFIVDGVILLEGFGLGNTSYRTLQVVKMRRTNIDGSLKQIGLDEQGLYLEEDERL